MTNYSNMNKIMGPKILLEGPAGTGKTYSLGTIVDWAQKNERNVFTLFTENGLETLLGYWLDRKKEIPQCLHYHNAMPTPVPLKDLIASANLIGKLSYESLAKMTDPKRSQNNSFEKILQSCADFPSHRGTKHGGIDSFSNKEICIIDSLSELSEAAFKMQIGSKPTACPSDYLVAQNALMGFLHLLTQSINCTVVMTAHVTRETDEITGSVKLMTKSIGKALSNGIPQLFSDVIYTVREGSNFYWDTAVSNVDVKTRNLPIQSKIKPDFGQIMNRWETLRIGVEEK